MSMEGRGLSPKTIRSRKVFFGSWCDWIGDRFFEADHHDIEAWMAANRDRWAPESRKRGFNDVRQLYRWCERDGLVERNPAALAWAPKVPRAQPRPASTAALDAALSTGRLAERLAIALMAYGGLRCLEVAHLRWGQVDFGDGIMWITGKGGQQRFVFINREAPTLVGRPGRRPSRRPGVHGRARPAGRAVDSQLEDLRALPGGRVRGHGAPVPPLLRDTAPEAVRKARGRQAPARPRADRHHGDLHGASSTS